MDTVRIGVIGLGNMGSEHCRLLGIAPEAELTCVADLRPERREWAKNNLPKGVAIFEDGLSLIAAKACDAVMIAVPHYQHPELSRAALERGLHVLCEKPMAKTAEGAKQMCEAAKATGKKFSFKKKKNEEEH